MISTATMQWIPLLLLAGSAVSPTSAQPQSRQSSNLLYSRDLPHQTSHQARSRSANKSRTLLNESLLVPHDAFTTGSDINSPLAGQVAIPTTELIAQYNVTWQSTPWNPPSIPIFVRSPYVSAWLWGGNHDRGGDLSAQWISFWNGNTLPMCGIVNVDGMSYTWMGVPANCAPAGIKATQMSMEFTSTQSTFVMRTGGVDVIASFLSPIVPDDFVRQSLPYAYMNITVVPNDGNDHRVHLYSDIVGEWASQDTSLNITWGQYTQNLPNSTINDSLLVQYVQLVNQTVYGEYQDAAQYGSVVFSTNLYNTTYQSGPSSTLRQEFNTRQLLADSPDTNCREIGDNQPGFAFAKDMGTVSSTASANALFAVGHYRDPAVLYSAIPNPEPNRSLYFMSQYPDLLSSITFFYTDFVTVSNLSQTFDAQVQQDSITAANTEYAALCALVARQVWSGTEITVGKDATGAYNDTDIMIFLKEIATSDYVSTIDILSPAYPYFAYINPAMLKYMLLPIILYAEQVFPNLWAPHDIGGAYPIANGAHQLDAPYYIEESSNMLFMGLAYTAFSGENDLITGHYPIFKQWADYLVNNTLYPIYQASTDDFLGQLANMTSLAVKGAVAIGCMGQLAAATGNTADAVRYTSLAREYAPVIVQNSLASSGDHLLLDYQAAENTWSSLYNLLPDKMFGLGVFNESVYDLEAAWYLTQNNTYGIPLDSRSLLTKSDWAMWLAAVYRDNLTLRNIWMDGLTQFLIYGERGQPCPDLYYSNNATSTSFVDRPVMGGAYAMLARHKLDALSNGTAVGSTPTSSVGSGSTASAKSENNQANLNQDFPLISAARRRRALWSFI